MNWIVDGPKVYIDDYAHHPGNWEDGHWCSKWWCFRVKNCWVFSNPIFYKNPWFCRWFCRRTGKTRWSHSMEIYPAREEAIEGVNAQLLLDKMKQSRSIDGQATDPGAYKPRWFWCGNDPGCRQHRYACAEIQKYWPVKWINASTYRYCDSILWTVIMASIGILFVLSVQRKMEVEDAETGGSDQTHQGKRNQSLREVKQIFKQAYRIWCKRRFEDIEICKPF